MNKQKPYLISAELEYVDQTDICPAEIDTFREGLTEELGMMGKTVQWVEAGDLRRGMARLTAETNLPIVSLDNRYVQNADTYLGISRAVTADLAEAGYDARLKTSTLETQFATIAGQFAGQEVALADDVVFSGEMIAWTARQLEARDIRIARVICGIAVGDGADKLSARGTEVASVVEVAEVEDEICERDFTLLPGSGRKILNQNRSALYIDDTFGKPEQWASIPPSDARAFCLNSLERNRRLLPYDMPLPLFAGYSSGPAARVITQAINERRG